jgi:hypothetical protein
MRSEASIASPAAHRSLSQVNISTRWILTRLERGRTPAFEVVDALSQVHAKRASAILSRCSSRRNERLEQAFFARCFFRLFAEFAHFGAGIFEVSRTFSL